MAGHRNQVRCSTQDRSRRVGLHCDCKYKGPASHLDQELPPLCPTPWAA